MPNKIPDQEILRCLEEQRRIVTEIADELLHNVQNQPKHSSSPSEPASNKRVRSLRKQLLAAQRVLTKLQAKANQLGN